MKNHATQITIAMVLLNSKNGTFPYISRAPLSIEMFRAKLISISQIQPDRDTQSPEMVKPPLNLTIADTNRVPAATAVLLFAKSQLGHDEIKLNRRLGY